MMRTGTASKPESSAPGTIPPADHGQHDDDDVDDHDHVNDVCYRLEVVCLAPLNKLQLHSA